MFKQLINSAPKSLFLWLGLFIYAFLTVCFIADTHVITTYLWLSLSLGLSISLVFLYFKDM